MKQEVDMILISLEEDKQTISKRFRKADYFAFLEDANYSIVKNDYKTQKSKEFFDYFNTLNVKKIYIKALGYKTFLKLNELGIEVYFVEDVEKYDKILKENLQKVTPQNAQKLCTLGHK